MQKNEERLKVIENIKKALEEGKYNKKVELNDPIITEEQREKVIKHFDILRNNPIKRIKRIVARNIAKNYTKMFNLKTEIIGLENLKSVKSGAIITSNHFNPKDSTVIMHATNKVRKTNHLDIVIEEENVFMDGQFGFLMNNCSTIPINKSKEYWNNNFIPSVEKLLKNKDLILIYPEEQMWFNYKKPRKLKIGAYHLAAKFNVPIIPCFTEMREVENEFDEDGFNKIKYVLHIMPAIYPEPKKDLITNKKEMRDKDYEAKVHAFEEAYGKKLSYKFEDEDIAGLTS